LIEFIRRFPVEIVSTLIVDALKRPVLMKLVGVRLCMEFPIIQDDVVMEDATKEFATIEFATSKEFVCIAFVIRLPPVFIMDVELRWNWETPSA
jgi:hypothetical protein